MRLDDELILEDVPCIEPGVYEAIVLSAKKVPRFGVMIVEFTFRIITQGPAFDVQLRGYCNLGSKDGRHVRSHSKLARWMRLVAAYAGISPSRVRPRTFRHYWLRVRVKTVTQDYRQRFLAQHDQYSTVEELVEVIGLVTERTQNQPSKPQEK